MQKLFKLFLIRLLPKLVEQQEHRLSYYSDELLRAVDFPGHSLLLDVKEVDSRVPARLDVVYLVTVPFVRWKILNQVRCEHQELALL